MAAIKSYTDIHQSKELAGILPLESANVCYRILPGIKEGMPAQYIAIVPDDAFFESDIPAWSLAALLNVLPNYQLQTQDDGIGILCSCNGKFNIVTADNPIDACVEMIIKLHEQNLL